MCGSSLLEVLDPPLQKCTECKKINANKQKKDCRDNDEIKKSLGILITTGVVIKEWLDVSMYTDNFLSLLRKGTC